MCLRNLIPTNARKLQMLQTKATMIKKRQIIRLWTVSVVDCNTANNFVTRPNVNTPDYPSIHFGSGTEKQNP